MERLLDPEEKANHVPLGKAGIRSALQTWHKERRKEVGDNNNNNKNYHEKDSRYSCVCIHACTYIYIYTYSVVAYSMIYLSIYIPWPFPPVWGVADNTKETTKTMEVSLRSSSNDEGPSRVWIYSYSK